MKREKFLECLAQYDEVLNEMKKKGDTGTVGKRIDVLVRDYMNVKGIKTAQDVKCRRMNQVDWSFRINGKYFFGETKTNSGEIVKGYNLSMDALTDEDILPNADYIAFSPDANYLTLDNFYKGMLVFTREQFIDMLKVVRKNGGYFAKVANSKRERINIQTWTSAPLGRFYDFIEENNIPTLEEFRAMVRKNQH